MKASTNQFEFAIEQYNIGKSCYQYDESIFTGKEDINFLNQIKDNDNDEYTDSKKMICYMVKTGMSYINISCKINLKSNEKYRLSQDVDGYIFSSISVESNPEYSIIGDIIDKNLKIDDITSIIGQYNDIHNFKLIDDNNNVLYTKEFKSHLELPNTPIPVKYIPYSVLYIVIDSHNNFNNFKVNFKKYIKNDSIIYDNVYVKDYNFFLRNGVYISF